MKADGRFPKEEAESAPWVPAEKVVDAGIEGLAASKAVVVRRQRPRRGRPWPSIETGEIVLMRILDTSPAPRRKGRTISNRLRRGKCNHVSGRPRRRLRCTLA